MPPLGWKTSHCRKGHSMDDAYLVKFTHSTNGKRYEMRQCRPCQKERAKQYYLRKKKK